MSDGLLANLGVYGYGHVEDIVVASLVTGKPLLLIGKAGTGKSFLLNSLSEALELEHRHYNASLIAFDDLVGFPFPEEDGSGIRYIETPATVWQAESVLIDEISRCKPEHQNRLFSLVHERRIQGMKLDRLKYCWAAMNPCSADQGAGDYYEGSVPLDQALADRFAFVIQVPDWDELDEDDREKIADPAGEGAVSTDDGKLSERVRQGVERLPDVSERYRVCAARYAIAAASALAQNRVRLSPRRVRILAGNLLALIAVKGGEPDEALFLEGLRASLPQAAWGAEIEDAVLRAAHQIAWDQAFADGVAGWLNSIVLEGRLDRKVKMLLKGCPDDDTGAVAVKRVLATLEPADAAVFALALYPAALDNLIPVGCEGVAALAKVASPILDVDAEISWSERRDDSGTKHPQLDRCSQVLAKLRGKRKLRARHLFYHLVTSDIPIPDPRELELTLLRCTRTISQSARSTS